MKKTVKALTKILANSYILTLKKQNYHWNVRGENFYSLHELFGKQYEEQFEAIDEIAERIRALGSFVTASFSEYLSQSEIKEEKTFEISSKDILKRLVADETKLITILNESLDIAQKEGDEPSADLINTRLEVHQKNKWMLEASL